MSITYLFRLKLEHEVRISEYEEVTMFMRRLLLKKVHDPVFFTMQSLNALNEGQIRREAFTEQDIAKVQEII